MGIHIHMGVLGTDGAADPDVATPLWNSICIWGSHVHMGIHMNLGIPYTYGDPYIHVDPIYIWESIPRFLRVGNSNNIFVRWQATSTPRFLRV